MKHPKRMRNNVHVYLVNLKINKAVTAGSVAAFLSTPTKAIYLFGIFC